MIERDFVIVFGSRTFLRVDKVDRFVDTLPQTTVVISGGAVGPDSRGVSRAMSHAQFFGEFPVVKAHWEAYGKPAGNMRNEILAFLGTAIGARFVGFWNGQTVKSGTWNMIQLLHQEWRYPVEWYRDGADEVRYTLLPRDDAGAGD